MSRIEWCDFPFKSLGELEELIPDMNDAEARQIHVDGITDKCIGGMWYPGYQAVVNKNKNDLAQLTTETYKILGHRDFFAAVVDMLQQAGLECHGKATELDDGNRWIVKCIFNDIKFVEPGMPDSKIAVGARFTNSYNGKNSASGTAYFLRLICTNQMIIKNVIPECTFSRNHKAETPSKLLEDVTIGLEEFVENLVDSGIVFTEVIEKAMEKDVVFDLEKVDVQATMKSILKVDSHADRVTESLVEEYLNATGKIAVNNWELYNVITKYLSHTELSPNVEQALHSRAERALLASRSRVVPVKAKAVV